MGNFPERKVLIELKNEKRYSALFSSNKTRALSLFLLVVFGVFLPKAAFAGAAMIQQQRIKQIRAQQQAAVQQQAAAIAQYQDQQVAMQAAAQAKYQVQHEVQQATAEAVAVAQQQAQQAAAQATMQAAAVAQYQAQQVAAQATMQAAAVAQYQATQIAGQAAAIAQHQAENNLPHDIQIDANSEIPPEVQARMQQAPVEVKEIATLDQMMKSLDQSSESWPLMIDSEAKAAVVDQYIQRYRREGVFIRKPSAFYAQMIDGMSEQSPEMLKNPLKQVLQVAAILEYDFDNGVDRDAMARKILGNAEAVAKNKQRLGVK